jgi:hypothetical protein
MTPIDRGAVSACQNQSNVAFIVGDHKWNYVLLPAASRALQGLSSRLMNRFGTTGLHLAGVILLVAGGDVGRRMRGRPLPIRIPPRRNAETGLVQIDREQRLRVSNGKGQI